VSAAPVEFREGQASDLRPAFELTARGSNGAEGDIEACWRRERPLVEFMAAQAGRWVVSERDGRLCAHARVARFGEMEYLSEIMVDPECRGEGIGRGLLERLWPGTPSPEVGRVVVGAANSVDLDLYTSFGAMPATGHWRLRTRGEEFVERRSHQDSGDPDVHVLESGHAVEEWKRLEPDAVGHERGELHEFFARTRSCLGCMSGDGGHASALCWVSPSDEIGPAVAKSPDALAPVVLAALDRVAKQRQPESLEVFCTADAWWLLDRLRRLGFRVKSASWVLCSVPLPGLDRYLPTWPARLL
jgi:GNAT superfamily N-acetyltransferase